MNAKSSAAASAGSSVFYAPVAGLAVHGEHMDRNSPLSANGFGLSDQWMPSRPVLMSLRSVARPGADHSIWENYPLWLRHERRRKPIVRRYRCVRDGTDTKV